MYEMFTKISFQILICFLDLLMLQGQLEDHGPFQSLSRLWGHHAHLAVFINYVLSNSDPSSLVRIIFRNYLLYLFKLAYFKMCLFLRRRNYIKH